MNGRLFPALLLTAVLLLNVDALAQQSPAQAFTKDAMLRDIAGKAIVPSYEELHTKCRELTNAVGQLVIAPDAASLENARRAWRDMAQAAGRIRCFQKGPIADRDCVSSFYHWQIFPVRIQNVLGSTQAIDQGFVDELGATTKGVFAIEFILFDPAGSGAAGPNALDALTTVGGERRKEFLMALAKDLQTKAANLARDWNANGGQTASAKFVNGGQESVNVLVNQLAMSLESTAEGHLNFVLSLRPPVSGQLDRIERSGSGSSLNGVIESLEGTQRLYRGGDGFGLDDAIQQQNPALAKRINEQFELALAAVRALGAPLENVVVTNRTSLQSAYEKTRALEILFKVDLASALGVTLTFSSADGD